MKQLKRKILALLLALALLTVPAFAEENQQVSVQIVNSLPQYQSLVDNVESMLNIIEQYYYQDVDESKLIESTFRGMFEGLGDPYSEYMSATEYHDYLQVTGGDFSGIGVTVQQKDGYVTVVSFLADSAAEKAGMKVGDRIVKVNTTDVKGKSLSEVTKLMKGEAGTKVTIGVLRGDETVPRTFEVTRMAITINPIRYEIKDGIAYIQITEFNNHVVENLKPALDAVQGAGLKKIILDLRDNPGGFLDEAVGVAQLLIPKGPILQIKEKDRIVVESSYLETAPFQIICLVNENSASCSEVLASAIQDSGGTIVGTRTYGKGVIQVLLPLTNGGAVKITEAEYLSRAGHTINNIGITPNWSIADPAAQLAKAKELAAQP